MRNVAGSLVVWAVLHPAILIGVPLAYSVLVWIYRDRLREMMP